MKAFIVNSKDLFNKKKNPNLSLRSDFLKGEIKHKNVNTIIKIINKLKVMRG